MERFRINIHLRAFRLFFIASTVLIACSPARRLQSQQATLLQTIPLQSAHVGICFYEPLTGKYWIEHQSGHYFVPASNVKIATCYAAMKYLEDSLVTFYVHNTDSGLILRPAGDPTFLHPDYHAQPAFEYLQRSEKPVVILGDGWRETPLGDGWSWNDYNDDYMAERSPLPVYGNVLHWKLQRSADSTTVNLISIPRTAFHASYDTASGLGFSVVRAVSANDYRISAGREKQGEAVVPFVTDGLQTAMQLLADTLHRPVSSRVAGGLQPATSLSTPAWTPIRSQPLDSMLAPMMHRSDNFFAEQSLLIVSGQLTGEMNDERIIDTLLKTDLSHLPQPPRWVDGSGLSRYNLFSPRDLVSILDLMMKEFGMARLRSIFPSGNEGTLRRYYTAGAGYIFAKTGSLSGVVSLSGFLYTKHKRILIFSVLVNNHNGSAGDVRRAVEKLVESVRNEL